MANDFAKVYGGFFDGSLRDQPPYARLLFLALLFKADNQGVVLGSASALAAFVNISIEEVRQGLDILAAPDPESTTPDFDGRRIEPWGEGANKWRIVNYQQYYERNREEERKAYKREWDRLNRGKNPTASDKSDKSDRKGKEKKEKEIPPKSPKGDPGSALASQAQSSAEQRTPSGRVIGPAPAEAGLRNGRDDSLDDVWNEVQSAVRLPYKND